MNIKEKINRRNVRKKKTRLGIKSNLEKARLSVFRSNKNIYVQVIDDLKGITICSANDKNLNGKSKLERAKEVGKMIAKEALEKKIEEVSFDRGPYLYHGRVKALAEGAREGGLKF